MGEKQRNRSTPLLVYWIIYQSDQLEEVGVYWKRDFKGPCRKRRLGVALLDFPNIEGSMGSLIGQRAKHFGIAFSTDFRISERGRI